MKHAQHSVTEIHTVQNCKMMILFLFSGGGGTHQWMRRCTSDIMMWSPSSKITTTSTAPKTAPRRRRMLRRTWTGCCDGTASRSRTLIHLLIINVTFLRQIQVKLHPQYKPLCYFFIEDTNELPFSEKLKQEAAGIVKSLVSLFQMFLNSA